MRTYSASIVSFRQKELAFKEGVAVYIRSSGYFEFVINLRAEAERAAKLVKDLEAKILGLGGAIANAAVAAEEQASAKVKSKKGGAKNKGAAKKVGGKRPRGEKKGKKAKEQVSSQDAGTEEESDDELAREEAELKAELKRLKKERVSPLVNT